MADPVLAQGVAQAGQAAMDPLLAWLGGGTATVGGGVGLYLLKSIHDKASELAQGQRDAVEALQKIGSDIARLSGIMEGRRG